MRLTTRTALMLHGALVAYAAPVLAADAKFDPSPLLAKVTRGNLKAQAPKLAAAIVKLAADDGIDVEGVVKVIQAVQGVETAAEEVDAIPEVAEEPAAVDADGDKVAKILAFLKGKVSDEDLAELTAMTSAEPEATDESPENEPALPPTGTNKAPPPAMDRRTVSKIAQDAATAARAGAAVDHQALRVAERAVHPFVGEVPTTVTTAADVYKLALDSLDVDLTGIPETAYGAVLAAMPKPNAVPERKSRIAQDTMSTHSKTIPGFDRLTAR